MQQATQQSNRCNAIHKLKTQNQMEIWSKTFVRTSQRQISEMLVLARRVIADTTGKLPSTQGLLGVDFVVESQGTKAAWNIMDVLWVETIRRK